jgi:alpha-tubulin suppressor-like RCC1 family protein
MSRSRFAFAGLIALLCIGGCRGGNATPAKAIEVAPAPPPPASAKPEAPVAVSTLPVGRHPVKKLAASPGHTCALLESGKVACWGGGLGPIEKGYYTNLKRPTFIAGIDDAVDVSSGNYHACAARASGKVVCWGSNTDGELGVAERHVWREHGTLVEVEKASEVIAIAGRATHSCAVRRNGRVICWGKNEEGQLGSRAGQEVVGAIEVPGVEHARAVAVSHTESCARLAGGSVMCWGGRSYGMAGHQQAPHLVAGVDDAVDVTMDAQVCITRAAGNLVCTSGAAETTEMRLPDPADRAINAALGGSFGCAVKASGKVACWGSNTSGELGDGTRNEHADARSVLGLDDATQVVASWNHLCARRRNGGVACWGANNEAQLGLGSDDIEPPFAVPNVSASKIAVGPESSCALVNENVVCWGHDFTQQQYSARSETWTMTGLEGIVDVALGRWHGCAVRKNGLAYCWGNPSNLGAQLPYKNDPSVRVIANVSDAVAITTGEQHTCVRRRSGRVSCFGQNEHGQLGDGSNRPSIAAIEVKGITDAAEVSAGERHTCVRRTNGAVVCWGANDSGQLGVFDPSGEPAPSSSIPLAVASLTTPVKAIAAGWNHTCALSGNGKVTCWGHQHHGRIVCSHGCQGQRFADVPDVTAKTLAVGGGRSCAITTDDTVKCWSQVVDTRSDVAAIAGLPSPASALAVEGSHSCAMVRAVQATANVVCWGRNEAGQVGAPPPYRTTPVAPIWPD